MARHNRIRLRDVTELAGGCLALALAWLGIFVAGFVVVFVWEKAGGIAALAVLAAVLGGGYKLWERYDRY